MTPEAVATADPEARSIVTGGAGTGKTHILRARLSSLVLDHDLSPGAEILTLSFTNAAVGEVRERLADAPARVRAAAPVTFDSLASRILADLDPGGPWAERDFDGRIREAASALEEADELGWLAGIRHVLLDEAQDLVDVRADFALTLIETLRPGYTVFGDPAQAIYGFSATAEEKPFLDRLERLDPANPPTRVRLEENHRARTEQARAALWAGPLLEAGGEVAHVLDRLLDVCRDCPDLGSAADAAPVLATARGRSAVLCRTNGEALLISEVLRKEGVQHRVQLGAEDRPLAGWVAALFEGWTRAAMNRAACLERLEEVAPDVDAEEAWAAITWTARGDGERVEIDRLRRGLRRRRPHDSLLVPLDDRLVVSSIHRSKGLEFDLVALVEPGDRVRESEDLAEETRILYVALTRAREDTFALSRPEAARWIRNGDGDRRRMAGFQSWKTKAVELRPGDVDAACPPEPELSKRLWSGEFTGEEVELRLQDESSDGGSPRWTVQCNGEVIGRTSEGFWQGLQRALPAFSVEKAPRGFVGAYVAFVETVVGSPEESEAAGLGTAGMWPVPRIAGLPYVRWFEKDEE